MTGSAWRSVLCGVVLALMPSEAPADVIPAEFRGVWAQRCGDPVAPRITLESNRVTVTIAGERHSYAGVTASHTWMGGVRASGKQVWLPISRQPNGPYAFVLEPPPYGKKGPMTLDEGHPDHGREVSSLVGAKFSRCSATAKAESIGEQTRDASGKAGSNWVARAGSNPPGVTLNGTAADRRVTLSGSCKRSGGPGFWGSLYGYPGSELRRIDDRDEPVHFAVAGGGDPASFPARLVYYAPEKAWVMQAGLPAAFLAASARGETLTIRNGQGKDVITFPLAGAGQAAQIMRQGCGT